MFSIPSATTTSLAAYKMIFPQLHYDPRLKDNQEGVVHYIRKIPMFFAVNRVGNELIVIPPPLLTPKN